jgi:DNA polymerase elongation subunit (family B)
MSSFKNIECFSYSWTSDNDSELIRCFALDRDNQSVCLNIKGFFPYCYIKLPADVEWIQRKRLIDNEFFEICKYCRPMSTYVCNKKELYYATLNESSQYLKCTFKSKKMMNFFKCKICPNYKETNIFTLNISQISESDLTFTIHEDVADPVLQFTSNFNIPTAGWLKVRGADISNNEDRITTCDTELNVDCGHVKNPNIIRIDHLTILPQPKIISFDIECYSSNPARMPNSEFAPDKAFQISCIVGRTVEDSKNYLFTLVDERCTQFPIVENCIVKSYTSEMVLLEEFGKFIFDSNAQVIIGYNIMTFDTPYLIERAKFNNVFSEFCKQSYISEGTSPVKEGSWSSAAYGVQKFLYVDTPGRLFIDLLPLVQRDYKFVNYKLNTVANELGLGVKDPLTPRDIFRMYEEGVFENNIQSLSEVGKYCFTENTLISTIHKNIQIKDLTNNNGNKILSWDKTIDKIIPQEKQVKFFNNGIHECLEIMFEDGRTIQCTPDHLIADSDGNWIESSKLKLGTRCKTSIILPIGILDSREMILARIVGCLITDGCNQTETSCLYFGNIMDANNVIDDIEKISGKIKPITINSFSYRVNIPQSLNKEIFKLTGMDMGNRTISQNALPEYYLNNSDINVKKEFLGGLFGGDGHCPSVKRNGSFTPIGFTQSRTDEKVVFVYFTQLTNLMKEFGFNPTFSIKKRKNIFIGVLRLPICEIEKFTTEIGYRYCYHKTIRATVATIYQRMKNLSFESNKISYDTVLNIKKYTNLSSKKSYKLSKISVQLKNKQYFDDYFIKDINAWISNGIPKKFNVLYNGKFPNVKTFLKNINAEWVFRDDRSLKNQHTYSVNKIQESFNTFNLKIISKKYIGKQKVYDIEVSNTHSFLANGIVVHNCVQDSRLVFQLYEKMLTWVGICEMASICNVPIPYLYTRGQQIKVYSQIYKYCTNNDIVVQRNMYTPTGDYVGATVFNCDPGLYENVVTFDFMSLYPTIIIAFNIDYSTFVKPEDYDKIPLEDCHEFEWEDHLNCHHDDNPTKDKKKHICAKRHFRFVKSPKGVVPTILQNLLDARKHTRNLMKDPDIEESYSNILDKRQLSLKVCANSAYGCFGIQKGMLPLDAGAMSITYLGRKYINVAALQMKNTFRGTQVGGDTDSVFIQFNHTKSTEELWDYCLEVQKAIAVCFPPPMKLEFEGKIYKKLLLLSKKRYMAILCERDGKEKKDMQNKGSLLVRRDSCKFIKGIYSTIIQEIFDGMPMDNILTMIEDYVLKMFQRQYSYNDFTNTKSLKNDVDYKFPPLPDDEDERKIILGQMRLTLSQYYQKLPAHVQLARKMRKRGHIAEAGSRIEYLITNLYSPEEKQCLKIEDLAYFKKHRDVLRLDYIFYLNKLVKPMDDLLNIILKKKGNLVKKIYDKYYRKYKMCREIEYIFGTEIIIE